MAMNVVSAGGEAVSHTYLIDRMERFTSEFEAKRFSRAEIERRNSIFRGMQGGELFWMPQSRYV
ncbi:MAG TPA: hypothetical protein H9796_04985 [Candidatus Butyricimonas faecavium]|nr:hypothetical protein [Candidatus Butyricimonas faecavium]